MNLIPSPVAGSVYSRGRSTKEARRSMLADLEMEVRASRKMVECKKVDLGDLEVKESVL